MSIGFVRSAMQPLAAMADWAPGDVFRLLTHASRQRPTKVSRAHGVINLDEIRLEPLPTKPDHYIAHVYSADDQQHVVLAAGPVTVAQVRLLATRLMRMNWREHLVTLILDDLDPLEMRATLTEAVAAMQLHTPQTGREGSKAILAMRGVLGDIEGRAHRWHTAMARTNFKDLMKAAESQPQIVERPGGEEVFILGRTVFNSLAKPKSAFDIVAAFSSNPTKPRRLKLAPRPAARDPLKLGKVAVAKQQA